MDIPQGDRSNVLEFATPAEHADPRRDVFLRNPVTVDVLVDEANEAGFLDWLADQIINQCIPHGLPLDGDGGLLAGLAVAARKRVTSRRAGPVRIELAYDPQTQETTADCDAGTTLATLRNALQGLALTAADLHPFVQIRRDGTTRLAD